MNTSKQSTKQSTKPGTKVTKVSWKTIQDLITQNKLDASMWQTIMDGKPEKQTSVSLEDLQAKYSMVTPEHIETIQQDLKDQQAKADARKKEDIQKRKEVARKQSEKKRDAQKAKVEKEAAEIRAQSGDIATRKRTLEKIEVEHEELTVQLQAYRKVCKEDERASKKAKREQGTDSDASGGDLSPVPVDMPEEILRSTA